MEEHNNLSAQESEEQHHSPQEPSQAEDNQAANEETFKSRINLKPLQNSVEQIKKEICNDNSKVCINTHAIDLSNFTLASEALKKIAESIEHVDVLFNNAGTYYSGTLDLDIFDFSEMIDLNVKGCFLVAQIFGRKMKMQNA